MRDDTTRLRGGVLRSGPLQSGLGQLDWLTYQADEPRSLPNVPWVLPATGDVPDDVVLDAVATLTARHESLRSSFDADPEGRPRQVVHARAEVGLLQVDDDAARHAFFEEPFDVASRPPLRVGRTPAGELLVCVAHIAIDGMGVWTLVCELTELLDAHRQGRAPALPEDVPQPVDQALHEAGAGRARALAALRHWDAALRDHPVSVLPAGGGVPGADVVRAELDSRAAAAALVHLHRSLRATPASLLTAAAYTALAVQLEQERLALCLTWSYRELPTTRGMVAAVFRDMPLLVDLRGEPTFQEVLRRLRTAVLLSGRHMGFDVLELHECAGRVEAGRGAYLPGPEAVSVTVDAAELEAPPPGVDLRDLLAESRTTTRRTDESWDVCNVYVGAYPVDGRLLIDARFDGSLLGVEDSAALAGLIEAVLVHAATHGDLTLDEVRALATRRLRPTPGTVRVGDVRVDLDALSARLLEHPAVQRAEVRVRDGRLTAHVTGDAEPWQLRDHLLSTDNGRGATVVPEYFEVRRRDGSTVTGPGVDAATTARDGAPPPAPCGATERALRDAVAQANGLDEVATSGTYLTVGGRLHLAPRVLALLREAGFEGLTLAALRRPTSLAALAGRLHARSATDAVAPS